MLVENKSYRAWFLKGQLALIQDYALLKETFCVIISFFFFFQVKAQQCFVSSSYMFLDKKTLLKIWLNPELNLTIFRETGPCVLIRHVRNEKGTGTPQLFLASLLGMRRSAIG